MRIDLIRRCQWRALIAMVVAALCSEAAAVEPDSNLSLRLGSDGTAAGGHEEGGAQTRGIDPGSSTTGDDGHPQWVRDVESKTWPGFLTGMKGYEDFVMPVGRPVYFEDPFITTDLRLVYIYHDIPDGSVLRGGQVHLVAAQIRAALSERLAFIATKDGYSWVDSHITPAGDGWNNFAIGLKYAVYSDPAEQFLVSTGLRWEWSNGSTDVWQGGKSQELSPFVAFAKGWDKWHFLGTLSGRIATDRSDANSSFVWDLHVDYELTETFRPLIEVHGIHWLTNADRVPISTDYLDVGSLGASEAAGHDMFSAGLGFRWQVRDNISVGVIYELPLESADENLIEQRLTFNTVISF